MLTSPTYTPLPSPLPSASSTSLYLPLSCRRLHHHSILAGTRKSLQDGSHGHPADKLLQVERVLRAERLLRAERARQNAGKNRRRARPGRRDAGENRRRARPGEKQESRRNLRNLQRCRSPRKADGSKRLIIEGVRRKYGAEVLEGVRPAPEDEEEEEEEVLLTAYNK